jgi:hypothetical protein
MIQDLTNILEGGKPISIIVFGVQKTGPWVENRSEEE